MDFNIPIKMPRTTHYGNNYYEVYSKKLKRIVSLFSDLEYANYLTLEMNPKVERFCEQPLEIEVLMEDKFKKAIFDFWVKYTDGHEEMQEVKYLDELNGVDEKALRSQEQIRRERKWCEEHNISFIVRTDEEIYTGRFYIKNLEYLSARARRYVPTDDKFYQKLVSNALRDNRKMSILDMVNTEILPAGHELEYISYLYYSGIVTMNICDRPIDGKMEVSLWQQNQ